MTAQTANVTARLDGELTPASAYPMAGAIKVHGRTGLYEPASKHLQVGTNGPFDAHCQACRAPLAQREAIVRHRTNGCESWCLDCAVAKGKASVVECERCPHCPTHRLPDGQSGYRRCIQRDDCQQCRGTGQRPIRGGEARD